MEIGTLFKLIFSIMILIWQLTFFCIWWANPENTMMEMFKYMLLMGEIKYG